VNVLAFSTPRAPVTFESIAQAMVAGRERVQLSLDRERPASARVPWHRRD
jgi:hypothetical protein